jgi:hypothetical protein
MTDEFIKFEGEKFGIDDFHFDVSSTIPEHELMEFNPTAFTGHDDPLDNNQHPTHMDPTQLIQGSVPDSLHNSYISPVQSPYTTASHLSTSFQAQRQGSIYDTLESIASPGQQSTSDALSAQYFSPPANKNIPFHTQRKNSYLQPSSLQHLSASINSPGTSFNDGMSPYSSFDALRSPRSLGAASPATGSLQKQQLSKDDKLKRRREFHNQVERRRRDLIKEKIKELGLIVPPSLLHLDADGKEVKASKSVIINKTVQYVEHLHKVLATQKTRQEQLIARIAQLEKYPDATATPSSQGDERSQSAENHNNDRAFLENSSSNATPLEMKDEGLDFDVNDLLKDGETWDFSGRIPYT